MARSAQDFIRALKAPADPPQPEGPSKIEIATAAWSDSSFYIPNKDEVITDWALTRLLKDKDKEPSNNPLLDRRYWNLLRDILAPSRPLGTLRSTKTWLISLLSRVPITPIIVSLLNYRSKSAVPDDAELIGLASQSLCLLWPLAVPKFSADTLLDGFGAVLRVFTQLVGGKPADEGTIRLSTLIIASYTFSATNTANRKKLYSNFKEHHLSVWLTAIVSEPGPAPSTRSLSQALYDAGIETIFNAEVLRIEDGNFVDTALTQLTGEIPDTVLYSLPRLFTSYVQNTRRHRSALYGQGSNQQHGASLQHARRAAISFFASCDSLLGRANSSELGWKTRLALLRAVAAENLHVVNDENTNAVLRGTGEHAVEAIVSAIRDDNVTHGDLALSVVSVILDIDYDLIATPTAMALPKLLLWPSAPGSAQKVLRQAMEFHTKTRTMDEFVELCLQSCTSSNARDPSEDIQALYTSMLCSPLLTREFLDELSRCLRFLTPGQIPQVVRDLGRTVSESLEAFKASDADALANSGEGSRKKRRSDAGRLDVSKSLHAEHHALNFSLAASLTSIVLASIPLQTLPLDVRSDVKQMVHELCDTFKKTAKDALKHVRGEERRRDIWGWEVVLAAVLSLQYHLGAVSQLEAPPGHGDKALSRMITLLKSEFALPELRAEACRSLLHAISEGRVDHTEVFDTVLDLLDRSKPDATATWNGRLHGLEDHQLSNAVFYLLLERWLPLFDSSATEQQLKRLAYFMSRISTVSKTSEERSLSLMQVWWMTLRNAQFWEMHRIRDALLSQINERSQDLPLAALFGLLLWMPIEYLSRNARSELLKRGIAADLAGKTFVNGAQDVVLTSVIREFVKRALSHMGAADHPDANEYLRRLIDTPSGGVGKTVSLELIRMHITSLIRAAIRGDDNSLKQFAESFAESNSLLLLEEGSPRNLQLESFIAFVDVITNDFNRQDFQVSALAILTTLYDQIISAARSRITKLVREDSSHIVDATVFLALYHRLLVLRQWLQLSDSLPTFGKALAAQVISAKQDAKRDSNAYSSILNITQQELNSVSENDRVAHVQYIIAISMAFQRLLSSEGRKGLEIGLAKFCRTLTASDYSNALDCIWDGLSDASMTASDLQNLVHLSSLFTHDSPEGSLKINQNHWTKCLQLFADRSQFLDEPALTTAVLESIAKKVNDRPASLRQQDLSSLWSILGSCVAGSSQHRGTTSHQIFRELVSVISALVRLRRDLVVSTLPHLGIVLRRLILCLKHPQPQLGAKQSRMVASSLPKWIDVAHPLTVDDGRAVARLLTTLATKSIVRTHSTSTSTQKAESLARPFSKHAAYVLGGYVDALNDPLSFLPADIRRELQPGLFALCEMMGEQNRDSMMVTLDTGGKMVMKTLWRDYEKQRYTGQG